MQSLAFGVKGLDLLLDRVGQPLGVDVQLLWRVAWFRGGLAFEAHRLLYQAQGPSRTCNESKEEEGDVQLLGRVAWGVRG